MDFRLRMLADPPHPVPIIQPSTNFVQRSMLFYQEQNS